MNENQNKPQDANTKPGTYPLADRANLFGTFLVQFHSGQTPEIRYNGFMGLMSVAYPHARRDVVFMDLYKELIADREPDHASMHRVAMEAARVMDEIGTWDYPGLKRSVQE